MSEPGGRDDRPGSGDDSHALLGRLVRRELDRGQRRNIGPAVPGRLYEAVGRSRSRRWPLALGGVALAAGLALAALPRPSGRSPVLSYDIHPIGDAAAPERPGTAATGSVLGASILRFSEGTAVTFRPESRGRVVEVSTRGAHIEIIEGRARAKVATASGSEWFFSAGPYRVEGRANELEVGWMPARQLFTVSLFSGRSVVRGPGINKEVVLRPGESLLARATDGSVQVGRGRGGLSALHQPDTERFTEALASVADEAATRSGGVRAALPGALSRGSADDLKAAADSVAPARDPGVPSCDQEEPSLLALAVPDPGPVSLATCRHVDAGPSGKDVKARTQSEVWVKSGPGGCLRYAEDIRGNRIPDFSHAGYRGGGVPLPRFPPAPGGSRLLPGEGGDDTPAIQAAIDAAAALPADARGLRAVVELSPGTFTLRGTLRLEAGGVVLRGQGSEGPGATVLRAVGAPRVVLRVGPQAKRRAPNRTPFRVTDVYVPVGARSFTLETPGDLRVGDDIVVHRPKTQRWICAIGTDVLPSKKDGRATPPWRPRGELTFERRIVRIDGNRITVDAPLTNALEKEYTQAFVTRLDFSERISEVGVEHLASVGEFTSAGRCPSAKADFIRLDAVGSGWVKNVRVEGYGGEAVNLQSQSKWITVEDVTWIGSADDRCDDQWAFKLGGQQNLILRGRTQGSHLTAVYTDTEVEGPNAVVDFQAVGQEVRMRVASKWSTGILFDNVRIQDASGQPSGDFDLARGRSTHGWSAVNSVVWNSEADVFSVDNPPTANNWIMGGSARALLGTGTYSSQRGMLQPQSLYKAQLAERLARSSSKVSGPSKGPEAGGVDSGEPVRLRPTR